MAILARSDDHFKHGARHPADGRYHQALKALRQPQGGISHLLRRRNRSSAPVRAWAAAAAARSAQTHRAAHATWHRPAAAERLPRRRRMTERRPQWRPGRMRRLPAPRTAAFGGSCKIQPTWHCGLRQSQSSHPPRILWCLQQRFRRQSSNQAGRVATTQLYQAPLFFKSAAGRQ